MLFLGGGAKEFDGVVNDAGTHGRLDTANTNLTTIEGDVSPLHQDLNTTNISLGTDGGSSPANGTGVRGWLRSIYDKLNTGIAVSGAVSVSNFPATQAVSGTVTANAGTGTFNVDGSGHTQPVSGSVAVSNFPATQPVSAAALPLPAGAATAGNQSTANTSLASIDTKLSGTLATDGSGHTQPVSGSVSVTNLPGTQAVSGNVAASAETGTVYNGSTALTPLFAKISASSSGAQQAVAAVTSKKIRVLGYSLVAAGAVNVKFQSHVSPTDLTGLMDFAGNGGISVPFSPVGHFETVAGEALDINLSGAVAVGGHLVYVTV